MYAFLLPSHPIPGAAAHRVVCRNSLEFFCHVLAKLLVLDRLCNPPPTHTHYLDLHLPCALLQCLHSNIFSMSHFAFDGVNTLSFAFDGTTAVSTFRLKRVQTFALFLIVAGCCVVGAASLGAGAYQAEGASNFEQLALAIMVYRWPPLLSRSKGLSHCRSLKCFRRTGRLRGSIKK